MDIGSGVSLEWSIVYHALLVAGWTPTKLHQRNAKLKAYGGDIDKQAVDAVEQVFKKDKKLLALAQHADEAHIAGNPEPKTDVIFGTAVRASVKMNGPIQLASGQGLSTSLMFIRVMEKIPVKEPKKLFNLIHDIEKLPTTLISEDNIHRLKKEKPDVLKSFLDSHGDVRKDASYQYWLEHNKEALLGHILDFLKTNPQFHRTLIKEALTGELVFGSMHYASANYILTPKEFIKIDDFFVGKMLAKTTIDIRAKSRSGITSIAFRFDVRQ